METQSGNARSNLLQQRDSRDRYLSRTSADEDLTRNASQSRPPWVTDASLTSLPILEAQLTFGMSGASCSDQEVQAEFSSMRLAEFVQRKFIPEYVAIRRSAGRAHYQAILKYVLPPEQVACAFAENPEKANVKLKAIQGWPYMDSLRLCDINGEIIQHLTSTALNAGYSIQTATHIRNVIRSILSHAIRAGCYTGNNPATLVTLPAMVRKKPHILTLAQLKKVMQVMRYPEKGIALFAILTEMNVSEICGLQWEYVNLSNTGSFVGEDWIPPRTIAVRNQSYRGEFGFVMGCRKRFVPVPEPLCSILRDLKSRKHFTRPQDFVLGSRSGTPIHPENIAARRLKSIGKALEMPWLSWCVFHRTHINLKSEFGRDLHKELEDVLPLFQESVIRQSQRIPSRVQSRYGIDQ